MSLGIGVIGAGIMGADHARIVATRVARAHVAAVCDADAVRAAGVAAETGARALPDAFALIADRSVAAVVIASPDETHADYTLACLAAGKPVLCEKPLAPRAADAWRVVQAEQASGRRLVQVGFMRRFDPAYVEMKECHAAGDLGAALLLHCVHRNVGAPASFGSRMSIANAAVHEYDVARWLLGTEIAGIQVLKVRPPRPDAMHDPLLIVLETHEGQLVDIEIFMHARYGYDIRTVGLPEWNADDGAAGECDIASGRHAILSVRGGLAAALRGGVSGADAGLRRRDRDAAPGRRQRLGRLRRDRDRGGGCCGVRKRTGAEGDVAGAAKWL